MSALMAEALALQAERKRLRTLLEKAETAIEGLLDQLPESAADPLTYHARGLGAVVLADIRTELFGGAR